jgi:hypothetical protein
MQMLPDHEKVEAKSFTIPRVNPIIIEANIKAT